MSSFCMVMSVWIYSNLNKFCVLLWLSIDDKNKISSPSHSNFLLFSSYDDDDDYDNGGDGEGR